ncbi:MAG: hypothetical protein M1415_07730 [Firmicutes bacterium]|nr:hypothetical protein [Bacillota bacterium]
MMICERTVTGADAIKLAATANPWGPDLGVDVAWVARVETWVTEWTDGASFVEFRIFDQQGTQRETRRVWS